MELIVRKIVTIVEEIYSDGSRALARPLRLAAAVAVIANPFAGRYEADLSLLSGDYSRELGSSLAAAASSALGSQAVVFGKAALVGETGEVEHGSAIIHTVLFGDELRAVAKGGAVVPSAEESGGIGSTIDVPLRSAQDVGGLGGTDTSCLFTWELRVSDGPRVEEILVIAAVGDGGRPNSRRIAPRSTAG